MSEETRGRKDQEPEEGRRESLEREEEEREEEEDLPAAESPLTKAGTKVKEGARRTGPSDASRASEATRPLPDKSTRREPESRRTRTDAEKK